MKKIFIIFVTLISQNAFALYNENIQNQCGVMNNNFNAIFTIHTHTCQNGYFLPANVDGCRPCPNGYTCNGGTFTFNPTMSQGAITNNNLTQTATNACAANAAHKMIAIFTPNTVTLNFDDDNGNTTNTTCTYDGLVNLPTTPTRPGYRFIGWKLQTNE